MLTTSQTTLEFRELKQEDRQWAAPLLERSGGNGCEYSFTTLFMWRKFYHNRIALQDGVLYICSGESYLPPVGGDMREGIERLWNHARGEGRPFVLYGADAALAAQIEQWYPGKLSIEPSPGDFDYLYNSGDLAELPGKSITPSATISRRSAGHMPGPMNRWTMGTRRMSSSCPGNGAAKKATVKTEG